MDKVLIAKTVGHALGATAGTLVQIVCTTYLKKDIGEMMIARAMKG